MVECVASLDSVFGALSDPTRRDMLMRVSEKELSVSELSLPYKLTFAAISKHLRVLERAQLIQKRRQGKQQMVQLTPGTVAVAAECLKKYQEMWEHRLDSLEKYLKTLQ
jgi:DNA-binding transcriptional ArsR family regulator